MGVVKKPLMLIWHVFSVVDFALLSGSHANVEAIVSAAIKFDVCLIPFGGDGARVLTTFLHEIVFSGIPQEVPMSQGHSNAQKMRPGQSYHWT